jgi:urease accessory protein
VENLAAFFLAEFSILPRIGSRDFRSQAKVDRESAKMLTAQETWRKERLQQEVIDGVLWSAAKVRGCTVIKFGSHTVEGGRNWIGTMIKEEGSVSAQFGEESLMCVRP